MTEPSLERFEQAVGSIAAELPYPPTPDVAGAVRARLQVALPRPWRLRRWAVAALIALLLALLVAIAVPPVRAALLRVLRIGAMQINLVDDPQQASLPDAAAPRQPMSILDLGEEMNLAEAAAVVTLADPPFPPTLGEPDAIYGQNLLYREPVISFLWRARGERPQILLTHIGLPQFALKWAAGEQVTETDVRGRPAIWIAGPHRLDLASGAADHVTAIPTNVLIWDDGRITYRLEADLKLEEALQIAESWP
jgi:hypothetical protein